MSNRPLYNETFQNREAAPTAYESLLGDSIERAFAMGIHDLEGLVCYLNSAGPAGPNGQAWTPDLYKQEMARLAA
ncbi:recombinase-like helix-turn-helix domain-containing protein [Hydrogenophaga aquatica]